ncbi:MAG: hypothetical protein IJ438_06210, partial [Clostridia bacterium]|nr:hypothetical protein [Clostridia bacterium]
SFGITVSCLRFFVLYRFQGSGRPAWLQAARVSLCILSNFRPFVNTFFAFFMTNFHSFFLSEQRGSMSLHLPA